MDQGKEKITLIALFVVLLKISFGQSVQQSLPVWNPSMERSIATDWLIVPVKQKAGVFKSSDGKEIIFYPTKEKIIRTIKLPLYYAGLTTSASVREKDGEPKSYKLNRNYEVELPVILHPDSYSWWVIE